jgi:DNA primase
VTRYTADSRDRVRDAVDMVALVSARTDLRRAGADSYFGLCPFHDERTPSFHVRPDEKHYHCFGCQASGDPFTFVMETEGLDFKAALELLADRFGVKLETEAEDPVSALRRQRRERLYMLLGRATSYYARYLWESGEAAAAREYLSARGLNQEILREFRVGYAPSAWDRMLIASHTAGFTDDELLAAGLAQRSKVGRGQLYDRFRGRIVFPSADARGRVRGFGARAMRDNQRPKYLNTSENELYQKRRQLFGIDLARASAARAGRMILVEGYTDVLALHQAGMRNAVGIMGTALTEEQVDELERIIGGSRTSDTGVLELCLDADRAGQEAMMRASRLASGRKLELRVVPLPDNIDPAELVEREGPEALRDRVERSVPFVVFHVDRILGQAELGSAEGRDRALSTLRPVLAELPASMLREDLTRRIAGRLELSEGQLASLAARAAPVRSSDSGERPLELVDPAIRSERAFLVLCVALPSEGRRALAAIDPDAHITSERLRRAARQLAGQTEIPVGEGASEDDELGRVLADLAARAGRVQDVRAEQLEQQRLYLELARLDRAIRRARSEHAAGVPALALERERVLSQIRALDAKLEAPV